MRRRHRDQRGAVILIVSLIMTVLLIVVAFVVDLGSTRATKRDAQAVADLAALDAGYFLSGSSPNSPGVGQPREACIAGIEALQRNVPGFLEGVSPQAECAGFPLSVDDCVIIEADPLLAQPDPIELVDGERTVTIRYPVRLGELNTGQFALGGARDGLEPCERMAFDLTKTSGTMFATIMGVGELSTGAGAVVRGTTDIEDKTPPAVLLLERTNCGVFNNSSGGSGNYGVIIEANGESPGLLHADSNATTNCSTNMTQSNAYAIYGTSLSGGAPSIVVTDGAPATPEDQPRRGAIRAAATNGRGAATYPGGLSVAPEVGGVVSRKIVDDKYNSTENPAIRQLHLDAAARLNISGAPAGHVSVDCTQAALDSAQAAGHTKVYVNCVTVSTGLTFHGFTDVVLRGEIVINGPTISFPAAKTITLHGKLEVQNGTVVMPAVEDLTVRGGVNVRSGGNLAVNSDSSTSCAGREGSDDWETTTRLAIFGGDPALRSRSNMALCQTTVYLAGPLTATHVPQQVVTGGSCTPTKPCPKATDNTATGARIDLQGNGRETIWSAPNRSDDPLPEDQQGLEDLALWMEGAGESAIKGGAILLATGVFFGPNADFIMSSPASGLPRDAQFVSRTMVMNQGTFRVAPNPNNAVMIPTAGVYGLIR